MKREDVEALLDEALDARGSVGHVDAEHLAALCRRWLAVDEAVVVCAGKSAARGEAT